MGWDGKAMRGKNCYVRWLQTDIPRVGDRGTEQSRLLV